MRIARGARFVCSGGGLLARGVADRLLARSERPQAKVPGERPALLHKGQYREAEIQFRNAIQVDSRFADAHYKLALAALKLEQWRTAYQELSTTIEIQPDHYAAHLDLANLLILGRQFNDAKEHLDLLVQKQPNNPDGVYRTLQLLRRYE